MSREKKKKEEKKVPGDIYYIQISFLAFYHILSGLIIHPRRATSLPRFLVLYFNFTRSPLQIHSSTYRVLLLTNIANVDPARWFIVVRIVLPPCQIIT
jgi:hypothetical protein